MERLLVPHRVTPKYVRDVNMHEILRARAHA